MAVDVKGTPFWMVWCPTHQPPTHKHPSCGLARAEATRLANLHPGHDFIVLQSVCMARKVDVQWTDLQPPEDDVPF